jgi:hypothetical protein
MNMPQAGARREGRSLSVSASKLFHVRGQTLAEDFLAPSVLPARLGLSRTAVCLSLLGRVHLDPLAPRLVRRQFSITTSTTINLLVVALWCR